LIQPIAQQETIMTSTGRSGLAGFGQALLVRITHWTDVLERRSAAARERRALGRLDDVALKDIGISRADATCQSLQSWWALERDRE
jgi:uncharacterized protein YjiS (DUF1127 family)